MSLPASEVDAAHTILTITDDGGNSIMTTEGPHGLIGEETIIISGNSVNDYNATHALITFVSVTEMALNFAFVSIGTGGQWELA